MTPATLRQPSGMPIDRVAVGPVLVAPSKVEVQDDGQAMIFEVESADKFFVRLQSWDEQRQHEIMRALIGRRVRVIVDVVG